MHPVIHDGLNQARIADFHRWAERDRLARAAIRARGTHRKNVNDPADGRAGRVVARRLLIILGTRSA